MLITCFSASASSFLRPEKSSHATQGKTWFVLQLYCIMCPLGINTRPITTIHLQQNLCKPFQARTPNITWHADLFRPAESAIIILEVKWHLQSFREIHTAATGYMTGQRIHTTACSVNNTQYKSALFQPTLENPHHQIFSYPECVTRSVVYVNGTDLCRSKEWHTVRLKGWTDAVAPWSLV